LTEELCYQPNHRLLAGWPVKASRGYHRQVPAAPHTPSQLSPGPAWPDAVWMDDELGRLLVLVLSGNSIIRDN